MFPKYVLLSICAFIRVHFGRPGKFSQHSPFRCIHTFFQKLVMNFFKEKLEVISFQKHVGFSARQLIFFFFHLFSLLAFFFLICSLFLYLLFFPFFLFFFIFIMIFVCFTYIFFWTMFLNEELYTVPEFQTSLIVMILNTNETI